MIATGMPLISTGLVASSRACKGSEQRNVDMNDAVDINGRVVDINGRTVDINGRAVYINGTAVDINGTGGPLISTVLRWWGC